MFAKLRDILSPNKNDADDTVFSLQELLEASSSSSSSSETLSRVSQLLQRNGWVLLKLTPQLERDAQSAANKLWEFFSQSDEQKSAHAGMEPLGYSRVVGVGETLPFKEKLSYVVAPELPNPLCRAPQQTELSVQHLRGLQSGPYPVQELRLVVDRLINYSIRLCENFASPVYGKSSLQELSQAAKLPLLSDDKNKQWALFDVALYTNHAQRGAGAPPINCASHFDPGLFALSVYSSTEGLQLQGSDGKFINVPLDCGVLWCGAASSFAGIKPAIHRVLYGSKPRLTFWIEVATEDQTLNILRNKTYDSVPNAAKLPPNIFPQLDTDVAPNASQKRSPSPTRLEKKTGVPMTKSKRSPSPVRVAERASGVPISKSMRRSPSPTQIASVETNTGVPMTKDLSFNSAQHEKDDNAPRLTVERRLGMPMSKAYIPPMVRTDSPSSAPPTKTSRSPSPTKSKSKNANAPTLSSTINSNNNSNNNSKRNSKKSDFPTPEELFGVPESKSGI